jgi:hypothetical protein
LLRINLDRSHEFQHEIVEGHEGIKPGWVWINFNYFISDTVFDYIVEAVDLLARDGWRLLPDYRFTPDTGLWRHRHGPVEPPLRLSQLHYDDDGGLRYPLDHHRAPESDLAGYLDTARALIAEAAAGGHDTTNDAVLPDGFHVCGTGAAGPCTGVSANFEHLRWFELPAACLDPS